jgi:homocitrate synthase
MGTSPQSRAFNHGRDLEGVSLQARSLLEDVRRNHPHLVLRFSGEDAFRTRETDLFRVYDEIAPLVDRLGLPDTVGVATPSAVAQRVGVLRNRYPGIDLEGHFHDDRGFSLTNALESIRHGVRYVNTSILGIGERSGITSLTALLFNLYIDHAYDSLEGYHLRGSYPLNVLVADKLRKLVPSKEPVSLTNRTHTAGVHQSAVLRDSSAYEAHPLDQFGVSESEILLGPLSGWNMIHYFLKEIRSYQLDEATAKEIAAIFKERVYQLAADVSPEQVLVEIAEKEFGLPRLQPPESTSAQILQRLDSPERASSDGLVVATGPDDAPPSGRP